MARYCTTAGRFMRLSGIRFTSTLCTQALLSQLQRSTYDLAPIDVFHTLHGLASLGFEPGPAYTSLFEGLMKQLLVVPSKSRQSLYSPHSAGGSGLRSSKAREGASPQALANSLWALATMSVLPNKAWMDEVRGVD